MITVKSLIEDYPKLDVKSLPKGLDQESFNLIKENIDLYGLDETGDKFIDTFISKLNEFVAKSEKKPEAKKQEQKEKPKQAKENKAYDLLKKVFPDLDQLEDIEEDIYIKRKKSGYHNFVIECHIQHTNYGIILDLSHTYVQNGDLMSAPRIQVAVDNTMKTVTPLDYESHNTIPQFYNNFMDWDTGKINKDSKYKAALDFLLIWFKNLKDQGFDGNLFKKELSVKEMIAKLSNYMFVENHPLVVISSTAPQFKSAFNDWVKEVEEYGEEKPGEWELIKKKPAAKKPEQKTNLDASIKVKMKEITIRSAEGDPKLVNKFPIKYKTWEDAHNATLPLFESGKKYPDNYDKVDFDVLFDDGEVYNGRLYLKENEDNPEKFNNVFGNHIRTILIDASIEAGKPENKAKADPSEKDYLDYLRKYDLGLRPNPTLAAKKPTTKKPTAKKPTVSKPEPKYVASIDIEITLIKRFALLHGKTKTIGQITSLLTAIKKAVIQKKIRSNSLFAKDIKDIQNRLESLIDSIKSKKADAVDVDIVNIEKYKEIGNSEKVIKAVTYIIRYMGLVNKSDVDTKAERLLDTILNAKQKGQISKKYANTINFIIKNLSNLKDNKVMLEVPETTLQGLAEISGLSGLGFTDVISDLTTTINGLLTPSNDIVSSSDMANMNFDLIDIPEEYREMIGKPGRGGSIMIYGNPGSGKSSLAIKLAKSFADQNKKVLLVSKEEGVNQTMKEKLTRFNAISDNIFVTESIPSDVSMYDYIVYDSANTLQLDPNDVIEHKQLTDALRLYVFQVTKDGKFRGREDFEHNVDCVLHAHNGEISSDGYKNRFGGRGRMRVFCSDSN